ncbi:retrovirus-related Pol polyprotein from transposon 17.6 [Trichonephila clavipes]|nr:retrovirus-related Pol polyprotein from transposon 17.6 [Trichonephila clavipes]
MCSEIAEFVQTCKGCQLRKPEKIGDRAPITPIVRPEIPFEIVNIDVIGSIQPPSGRGHNYVLCRMDQHTRWPEAVPLRSLTAKNACDSLLQIFSKTGIPSIIASDQATNFKSALTQEFTKRIGSSPRFSCPGYPASNGLVERWNKKQKAYGDYLNKRSSVKNFSIGEQVLLLIPDSSDKIYARWTGPGEIIQHHLPHSYKVKLSDGTVRHVHVNKIRKYHPRTLAVGVIFEGDHEFGEIHPTPNLSRSTSERVLHEINLNHLKESERKQLLAIVLKHQTLFTSDVKIAKVGAHRIRLKPNIERKKPFVYISHTRVLED